MDAGPGSRFGRPSWRHRKRGQAAALHNPVIFGYMLRNGIRGPGEPGMTEDRLQSLAVQASRGDSQAFGELYGLAVRRVYGLCRHLLGTPEAAEDATSEVFLKVHRAFQGVAGSYNPE